MQAPPNYGAEYARSFNGIYRRLAEKHGAPLYPFFLEGVAGEPKLNLPDGIHPTRGSRGDRPPILLPLVEAEVRRIASR